MKVGIIVHSLTGHTLSVANLLEDKLTADGHQVVLESLVSEPEQPSDISKVNLQNIPDVSGYDAVFFGAPVWAFSPSSVMRAYLQQIPSLAEKRAGCFVTQAFPFAWMGGNSSIRIMKELCEDKGAEVLHTGIINWGRKKRDATITDVTELLSSF